MLLSSSTCAATPGVPDHLWHVPKPVALFYCAEVGRSMMKPVLIGPDFNVETVARYKHMINALKLPGFSL